MNLLRISSTAVVASWLAACAPPPKQEPELISSAQNSVYVETYPDQLNAAVTGFTEVQEEARKLLAEFNDFPGKIKDPDAHAITIVDAADVDGHSYQYVERLRRVKRAAVFFDVEKDEITKKIGGATQYAAKKKGCDVDMNAAVSTTFKDVVEKQLDKELHDVSEAHRLIDRYRGTLGKDNAAALEKQSDTIAKARYLIDVELVEIKVRITRLMTEGEQVKRTIDTSIEAEKAQLAAHKKATDAEKKGAEARIAALQKSKAAIDAVAQQGSALAPRMEQDLEKIRKEHADALEKLKNAIRAKVKK